MTSPSIFNYQPLAWKTVVNASSRSCGSAWLRITAGTAFSATAASALHGAQGTNFQWDHVAAGACRRERSIARLPWGSQTATFDGRTIQVSDIGNGPAKLRQRCQTHR